jgi:hypothetical protein
MEDSEASKHENATVNLLESALREELYANNVVTPFNKD